MIYSKYLGVNYQSFSLALIDVIVIYSDNSHF